MENIDQSTTAAARLAVEKIRTNDPVPAQCPSCKSAIAVTYVEPPADRFVTKCQCRLSNRSLPGVMPPPARFLAKRDTFLKKAANAELLDSVFYAIYFNEREKGDYFGCPLDPMALATDSSKVLIEDSIRRVRQLIYKNAYVGAAFFEYTNEPLSYEQAVQRLKSENPNFSEDVYGIVIHDSIRAMR